MDQQATIDGDVLKQELGELAFQGLVARSLLRQALLRIQELEQEMAARPPMVAGSDEPAKF
jgi:hypothetical protein